MKKVPSTVVKKRSRELTTVFESFTPYTGMEGRLERIWITEIATDGVHLVRCDICILTWPIRMESRLCLQWTRMQSIHFLIYFSIIWCYMKSFRGECYRSFNIRSDRLLTVVLAQCLRVYLSTML